ncbi:helix-turn-helix domain-containing protein [Flindersiella endophytica]
MNETLRRAILAKGLTEEDVATALKVVPKTVRRWINGRTPFARFRIALSNLLDVDEEELWPELRIARAARSRPDEVKAVYPHRWSVTREAWRNLFASAEREIGILAYSGLFLAEDAEILGILADKARAGVKVRICLGDPTSPHVAERGTEEGIGDAMAAKIRNALALYRPLLDVDGVRLRLHRTVLYNSLYLTDDELLVNQHAYGIPAAHSPAFHLQRTEGDDMYASYLESFKRIWTSAQPNSH